MKPSILFGFLVTVSLGVCANPLNQATSDSYAEACSVAESNGRLEAAEQACYRALVNVDWGNLGSELKSQRLYNLGRIKRQLAEFSEAEQLFRESLSIEESLSGPSGIQVGRRLVELSVSLAAQNKWTEGAQLLDRLLPFADEFSGKERNFAVVVLTQYSKHLRKADEAAQAERFEAKALSLR